jgi:hypothetical protein
MACSGTALLFLLLLYIIYIIIYYGVFEDRVLRKIFETKRKESRERQKIANTEQRCNFHQILLTLLNKGGSEVCFACRGGIRNT